MAGCEKVERRMRGHDPKSVMVAPESLESGSFLHVPYADRFVFRGREDQVLAWVEHAAGHVVVMPSATVNFPGF